MSRTRSSPASGRRALCSGIVSNTKVLPRDLHRSAAAPDHLPRATEHISGDGPAHRGPDETGIATRRGWLGLFHIEKYQARAVVGQLGQLISTDGRGARVATTNTPKIRCRLASGRRAWPPGRRGVLAQPVAEGLRLAHRVNAMSMKLSAPASTYTWRRGLIFPHHEDEIAQSEGAALQAARRRFVILAPRATCWSREKDEQVLGNFFTLRDLLNKASLAAKFVTRPLPPLSGNLNFTLDGLQAARRLGASTSVWRVARAGVGRAEPDPDLIPKFPPP